MKNITLLKLRLKKAQRNLQDYLKIRYVNGAIRGDDQRYISIWEDYQLARESLVLIEEDFFSSLDKISLPQLIEARSVRLQIKVK